MRLLVTACVALVVAGVAVPCASAHVGELKTHLQAGPYRLVVAARAVAAPGNAAALALRSTISSARGGEVASAVVSVRIAEPSGRTLGDYRLSGFGGVYSSYLPIPNADHWRSLRYTFVIEGPLGRASGRYVPPDLFDTWLLEPAVLAVAALGAALYLQGFVRLRRRGRADHASLGRLVLFALGLLLLVGPLVSPIDVVGDSYLLSAHMLQHVLIGDAGPALVVLSVRGPLVYFLLPPGVMRVVGRSRWMRGVGHWLSKPFVVVWAWALAYGTWHIPSAYDYAATHQLVHDLEHTSFVFVGFLLWCLLIDPGRTAQLSRGRRLAVAACVFGLGTVISDILIFSLHPLYPLYAGQAERVLALSPLRDQQLAGLVMSLEQIVTLGTFAVLMLVPMLRARERPEGLVAGLDQLA